MSALPFPYATLPSVSREALRIATQMRNAATAFIDTAAIAAALSELVDESVVITVRRFGPLETTNLSTDGVGVLFSPADGNATQGSTPRALLEVEAALAATLVARALRHRAPRVVDASRTPSSELSGAVAAVLHSALRRAHTGVPIRVMAAGPASALARDLLALHGRIATAWLDVVVGGDAFGARVNVPLEDIPIAASVPFSARMLEGAKGDTPLRIPLVVATCLADRDILASLRPGDVFVVPRFALTEAEGLLAGPVAIVAPKSERGLLGHLGPSERLMLGSDPIARFPWDRAHEDLAVGSMTDQTNPPDVLEVIEDAPVVVRVELGVVEMRAREWAALTPGDVVTLGRKLGDPAVLRVGGVEVERGELVQVDGEYGVRILPRAGERR